MEGGHAKPKACLVLWAVGSCGRLGGLSSSLSLGPTPWVVGRLQEAVFVSPKSLDLQPSLPSPGLHCQNCLSFELGLENKVSQSLGGKPECLDETCTHSLSLLLTSPVVLGNLYNLSVPQFPPV